MDFLNIISAFNFVEFCLFVLFISFYFVLFFVWWVGSVVVGVFSLRTMGCINYFQNL